MLDKPKCYNCEKKMEVQPPYFCSDKCKLEYWHESPDKPQEKKNKSLQEIQAGLARLAREAKPLEPEVDEAADYFDRIMTIPIRPDALPTAFGRGGVVGTD